MEDVYYYQEDLVRTIELDDITIYIFIYMGNKDNIYKMYDDSGSGESADYHDDYVEHHYEIAFLISGPINWPVIAEIR
jgi:hypothetical protein